MKRIAPMILPLCLVASSSWAGLSATGTLATDYVAEGVSQTDNNPAYQGSVDYNFDSGVYLSLWASNIDFGHGDDTTYEQDWIAGWTHDITKDVALDVAYTRYTFTGAQNDADFDDYYVGVTVFENTTIGYHYENDGDINGGDLEDNPNNSKGGKLHWWVLEQTIPLNDDWSAGVILNYKQAEDGTNLFGPQTGDEYTNWNFTLNTKWQDFDWQLLYSDTNIAHQDDPDDLADARLVLSVSRTFDF